ncbi:MAG: 1-acyl-sn-glycerol-3-phosphate acyltransferase [Deltaproteobacteria bacterium]|nr:1-acyl-sn-glycerol-3-phosphate acyltransferase [Deltaproteobacteria bacterium]
MTTVSPNETGGASAPSRRRARPARADTFEQVRGRLSWLERFNIRFIKATFASKRIDRALEWGLRTLGAGWVHLGTRNIRVAVGIERARAMSQSDGFLLMSNHRSFFDMFVIQMVLYRSGFRRRLLFPVRSTFFYDHPAGFFVNGLMSFFSMYPPVFRDRNRLMLNHTAYSELVHALKGGRAAGIHPEGTRNKTDDPYTLLPAQAGIGRAIHQTKLPVVPVFINGLGNGLWRQLIGNATGRGRRVIVVFGEPVDFGDLLSKPGNKETYQKLTDRVMETISSLGLEERALRATLEHGSADAQG